MDEFPLKRVSAYLGGPFLNSSQLRLSLIHQEPPKLFHLCVKSITRNVLFIREDFVGGSIKVWRL
jgi:hypothetical protein